MTPARDSNLFGVLGTSLAEFRSRVEGEAGKKIAAMGRATGVVPDVVRNVLTPLAALLQQLRKGVVEVQGVCATVDPGVALIEAIAEAMPALAASLGMGNLPERLGLSRQPFDAARSAAEMSGQALQAAVKVAHLLPSPEDLAAIDATLTALLGANVDPASKRHGSLLALMETIGAESGAAPQ